MLLLNLKGKHFEYAVSNGEAVRKSDVLIRFDKAAIEKAGYDFDQCIALCRALSRRGGCVLLSPACASFDMFKNFEERGRVFKDIVNSL